MRTIATTLAAMLAVALATADHVTVEFKFDNYDACEAEKEAAQRAEL